MQEQSPIFLSVVMPFRNDRGNAASVLAQLSGRLVDAVADFEIIVVDHGSSDAQFDEYRTLIRPDGIANLQVFRLMQATAYETAVWAGIENSLGDYVLVFDPHHEDLSRLEDALQEVASGRDIVLLRNTTPTDFGATERFFGGIYRQVFRRVSGIDLESEAAPGRLISKRVVSYLMQYPRPELRYRTLPALSGFSRSTLTYAAPRHPSSSRSIWKRMRRAGQLLVGTTLSPLRIASFAALAGALLNLLYSVYVVLIAIFKTDVAPGWTTLSLQQSGMFLLLSIVAFTVVEYIIQILRQAIGGPAYFITGELTSAVLTRQQRLNVESPVSPSDDPRQ